MLVPIIANVRYVQNLGIMLVIVDIPNKNPNNNNGNITNDGNHNKQWTARTFVVHEFCRINGHTVD